MRWSRPGSLAASIVVVVAGVGVALVPTLYTVYPEGAQVHHTRRLVAIIAWAVCVAIVGVAAARRDFFVESLATAVSQVRRRVGDRREEAYYSIIATLLQPTAHGLSSIFAFKVFRPLEEESGTYLVPLNEPYHEPWERWEIGHGAVGLSWKHARADPYIMLDSEKLSDPRLGLSARQQAEYGSLMLVAACSMHDESGKPIAILAVSSADRGASDAFEQEEGPRIHRKLADDLGVLLADLFLADPPPADV